MSDIPKFNTAQKEFIHAALQTAAPVGKIIDDVMEIYPQFRTADTDSRSKLSDRITKIKERMPEPEKKAEWQTIPHYLSAHWRLAYFRALLGEAEDASLKIRLLGEIRKEVNAIDQQNKDEEPDRKEAYDKKREREWKRARERDPANYDPQTLADEDARWLVDMQHDYTCLAIKSYQKVGEALYKRKADGVVVDKNGVPEQVGEKTHMEWIAEQKQKGLYVCDQKIEAEVIPSVLVLDNAHRDAYEDACKNGWIFKNSVLPKKAYKIITKNDYEAKHYRRLSDGVVVDHIGIPFTAGEKDHHTWLAEQDGLYNYDPKTPDKTQTITDVLANDDSQESKHA